MYVFRSVIDFCILILYPATLLDSCSFQEIHLRFFSQTIIIAVICHSFVPCLPNLLCFSIPGFTTRVRTSGVDHELEERAFLPSFRS